MNIEGWVVCIFLALVAAGIGWLTSEMTGKAAIGPVIALILIIIIFGAGFWYYNNTASGIRARVDQRAELQNGLDRTITIYTADGTILKQYEGKIDIEQDQGYVKFDWNGKRYIYYNCYIETIANID